MRLLTIIVSLWLSMPGGLGAQHLLFAEDNGELARVQVVDTFLYMNFYDAGQSRPRATDTSSPDVLTIYWSDTLEYELDPLQMERVRYPDGAASYRMRLPDDFPRLPRAVGALWTREVKGVLLTSFVPFYPAG